MKLFKPFSFDSFLGEAIEQEKGGCAFSQEYRPSPKSYSNIIHPCECPEYMVFIIIKSDLLTTTWIISFSCTLTLILPRTKFSPPDFTNVENRLKLVRVVAVPAPAFLESDLPIELTSPMLPVWGAFLGTPNIPPPGVVLGGGIWLLLCDVEGSSKSLSQSSSYACKEA